MINLLDLLKNVILSRALYTAAELNLAEELDQYQFTASALAQKINVSVDGLTRLMDFLILNDIFAKNAQGLYQNNESSFLISSLHPQSIKPFVMHDDPTRWNSFGNLTRSIKTGKDVFSELYGESYFSFLSKNQNLSKTFDSAMTIISSIEDEAIAAKIEFSGTVVDIGGGVGQLLDKIQAKQPAVKKTILFDLPEVVANVSGTKHEVLAGSFFEHISLMGDFLILKRILHDWNDEACLLILKNIARQMSMGDSLLIFEGLLDRSKNKVELAACDLALLSIFGGKERTLDQFNSLVRCAGLSIIAVSEVTDTIFGILCKKEI